MAGAFMYDGLIVASEMAQDGPGHMVTTLPISRRGVGAVLLGAAMLASVAAADDTADCAGGDPRLAFPACARLIEQAGEPRARLADAYSNRGRLYLAQDQLAQALADLDEALRQDPRHANARHNRGVALAVQGRYAEALGELGGALRLDPKERAESHHVRGHASTERWASGTRPSPSSAPPSGSIPGTWRLSSAVGTATS